MSNPLPRALETLWREPPPRRRGAGLTRERIVKAAIDVADADGLAALSMARLAEHLGCGTMSIYRHVANKDDLVTLMVAAAVGPPPQLDPTDWVAALRHWSTALWEVYHRHPWILQAAAAGPPADPQQLAWLDTALAALQGTGLAERDKLAAVTALMHLVRGAAALHIDAGRLDWPEYPVLLRRLIDADRFPALTAALDAGAFDPVDADPLTDLHSAVDYLLDGIAAKL